MPEPDLKPTFVDVGRPGELEGVGLTWAYPRCRLVLESWRTTAWYVILVGHPVDDGSIAIVDATPADASAIISAGAQSGAAAYALCCQLHDRYHLNPKKEGLA